MIAAAKDNLTYEVSGTLKDGKIIVQRADVHRCISDEEVMAIYKQRRLNRAFDIEDDFGGRFVDRCGIVAEDLDDVHAKMMRKDITGALYALESLMRDEGAPFAGFAESVVKHFGGRI